jgi:hypothetical protein
MIGNCPQTDAPSISECALELEIDRVAPGPETHSAMTQQEHVQSSITVTLPPTVGDIESIALKGIVPC